MNTSTHLTIRFWRRRIRALAWLRLLRQMGAVIQALRLPLLSEPQIYGDPRYEAWTADGEPIERVSPAQAANDQQSRYLIVPHGRSR